jgi:SSS family solute:Na+ symporter
VIGLLCALGVLALSARRCAQTSKRPDVDDLVEPLQRIRKIDHINLFQSLSPAGILSAWDPRRGATRFRQTNVRELKNLIRFYPYTGRRIRQRIGERLIDDEQARRAARTLFMQTIDWVLVVVPLVVVLGVAVYTQRYVKSVADFLSAGRCAGRYLLANARGESDAGLANTMSKFEIIMVSGFVVNFWEKIQIPVLLLVGITGFVVYRFRETRGMTLAQFLEMRYSRRFRLFMGILGFISGILNYGIFPAVSARFFVYFLDLPHHVSLLGLTIPTVALIMVGYLSCTLTMVLIGGQVTAMVTDCLEGLFSHLAYIVIVIGVLCVVHWHQIVQVMSATPVNKSMINPFDAKDVDDFNVWFVLMTLAINVYTTMALQNKQGFNSAARTPHESRMGGVLGYWRGYARSLMLVALGVAAVTFLRHPDFAAQSAVVERSISTIKDTYLQKQMTVPIALSHMLPVGVKGLFCSIMIMGLIAGDAGHLHSWGSIFVQDVVLPLRRTSMTPRQHIWMLRLAVTGVAIFAIAFSLLFTQTSYISLWWAITMGIFTGGAGAAIIGGLYWKKGTTVAAWSAAITGSILSFVGIACSSKYWLSIAGTLQPMLEPSGVNLPVKFWFNGTESAFIAACAAATVYIAVSLITCRRDFNLDQMLHRGQYADEKTTTQSLSLRQRLKLHNILAINKDFSFWDRMVAFGIFWWSIAQLVMTLTVALWNWQARWPISWWSVFWYVNAVALPFFIAFATFVWFTIGGIADMRDFFRTLRTMTRDSRDDGRVVGNHNLADEPLRGFAVQTAPSNPPSTRTIPAKSTGAGS